MLETPQERIGFLKAGISINMIEKLYVAYNKPLNREQKVSLLCSLAEVNIVEADDLWIED